MIRSTLILAVFAFSASPSSAQNLIDVTTQFRTIDVYARVIGPGQTIEDSDGAMAPDTAPFTEQRAVDVLLGPRTASANAAQTSTIEGNRIAGTGSVFATAEGALSDGAASSRIDIRFRIDEPVDYVLDATVTSNLIFSFTESAESVVVLRRLRGVTMSVAGIVATENDSSSAVLTGYLQPGEYRLDAYSIGEGLGDQGLFEAGGSFDFELTLTPRATPYCVAAPNSAGPGATLSTSSDVSVLANDFQVDVLGAIPNSFGLLYYGPGQIQAPFGDGFRCVGGGQSRVQPPIGLDANGAGSRRVDFTSGPAGSGASQITANSTWNFQVWYRDAMGPLGSGFNFSDGLGVSFAD